MKKHDNDIWTTKVRPVTRRDDKITKKDGTPLSQQINHARARLCPENVRAFRAIVVIKNDIALITDRNLLSRYSLKPERGPTVIALVISGGSR